MNLPARIIEFLKETRWRLMNAVFSDSYFLVLKNYLISDTSPKIRFRKDQSIHYASPEELEHVMRMVSFWKRRDFKGFLKKGGECFVICVKGKIIGYCWCFARPLSGGRHTVGYPIYPKEMLAHDTLVSGGFRGAGLMYLIPGVIIPHYMKQGLHYITGIVEASNPPALKNYGRYGSWVDRVIHRRARFGVVRHAELPYNQETIRIIKETCPTFRPENVENLRTRMRVTRRVTRLDLAS